MRLANALLIKVEKVEERKKEIFKIINNNIPNIFYTAGYHNN